MDFSFVRDQERNDAQTGLAEAISSGETAEQMAALYRKARTFDTTPIGARTVLPQEEAAVAVQNANLAALQADAPELVRRMGDPSFATLVKDDLANQGAIESAIWKMSPEPGQQGGLLTTLRNSLSRGLYGFYTKPGELQSIAGELQSIKDKEDKIAAGVPDAEIFGGEGDPTGVMGRKVFEATKDREREALLQKLDLVSNQTAWANQMQALFPRSKEGEAFSKTDGFWDALSALAQSPLAITADIGPESLAQMAPAVPLMAAAPNIGIAALIAGANSFGQDKGASFSEKLSSEIDWTNPEAIREFFASNENAGKIAEADRQARMHALGVAAMDALSMGVASKSLVPQALSRKILDTAAKREFANIAVQMPVQGLMGGAGEAAGQLMSDGEISSWADVVAEFAGEHFTAPVEVMTAGLNARMAAAQETQRAEQAKVASVAMKKALESSQLDKLDPQTQVEVVSGAAKRAGLSTVSFDAESFQQAGLDKAFPELQEQISAAVTEGGRVDVPLEKYVDMLRQSDDSTTETLSGLASFEQQPSAVEAAAEEQAANVRADAENAAAVRQAANPTVRSELAEVGRIVGKELRDSGITKEEASGLQAIYQAAVATMSRRTGMSPKQIWTQFGPRILGEPDITRSEAGEIQIRGSSLEAFAGSFQQAEAAMESPDGLGPMMPEYNGRPAEGLARLRQAKTGAIPALFHHKEFGDIGIMYGKAGDPNNNYRHGYGLAHIDAKHPGAADQIQAFLDDPNVKRIKPTVRKGKKKDPNRVVITNLTYRLAMTRRNGGNWIISAYELNQPNEGRPQSSIAAPALTRGHDILTPQPAIEEDSTPAWKTTLSKHKGKLSQGSKGDFFPEQRLIARWKNADRSTLLHESGHAFLSMEMGVAAELAKLSNRTAEQEAYLQSMQQVLDWFGVKSLDEWTAMSVDEQRPYHEKFARSFEAYVMEGKPPVRGLEKAFRDFARWLKAIYQVIANIPDAELTDDVRQMFDAMFSAEEEVRSAAIQADERGFFTDPSETTFSSAEWLEYQEALADTISEAVAEQTTRNVKLSKRVQLLHRKSNKEIDDQAKAAYDRIHEEEEERYKQSTSYQTWDALKNGIEIDGEKISVKLFTGDLLELGYSKSQVAKLHKAGLASLQKFRGRDLDLYDVAELLGYPDASALVDDLLANLDPKAVVNSRADKRFIEENPDLSNEKKRRDLASAAIFNEAKMRVLSIELSAMERTLGREVRTDTKAIERVARERISSLSFDDLKIGEHMRASRAAGKRARGAWAKGDIKAALIYQRQAIYQAALSKTIKETLMEVNRRRRAYTRYRKKEIAGINTPHLAVIQRVLSNMGFSAPRQVFLNPETETHNFMTELGDLIEETGVPFDANPQLLNAISRHDTSFLSTVDGWRQFDDFIKDLDAAGRREKHFLMADEKAAFDEVDAAVAEEIAKNAEAHGRPERTDFERTDDWFVSALRRFGLNHARAASVAAVLDGSYLGKFTRLVIYSADKCGTVEAELKSKYTKKLHKIYDPIMASMRDSKQKMSRVWGTGFTKQEAFVAALNYGNEGNRQRVLATIQYRTKKDPYGGVDVQAEPDKANAVADRLMTAFFEEYLTSEDLKAVQAIWDIFEEIRGQTDKTAKKILGRSPIWVEPRPLTVGGVTLTGGYYPISYDRRATVKGSQTLTLDQVNSTRPVFDNAGVNDGHLKSRVAVNADPIVLTPRAMFEGLTAQIHYISWAEWVRDTRKIFSKKTKISDAILRHYGADYHGFFTKWAQDIRNGTPPSSEIDDVANFARRNVSLAGIGFNLGAACLQLTGVTQSIAYLGASWTRRGVAEFLKLGYKGAYEWVSAKSPMMRERVETQFRELVEIQSELNGDATWKRKFMQAAYIPLTRVQMCVDLPTWLGAYEKALAEGRSEGLAVADADRAVMNSQGSGRVQDLSGYERGNAWTKLFTVFYTFFNTALNLAVVAGKTEELPKAAAKILLILVVQPALETLLKAGANEILTGGDDDDDDDPWRLTKDVGMNVLQFNLGTLVGVRELSGIFGDYGYQGPSGTRKVTDAFRLVNAIERDVNNGELSEATLKAGVSAMGSYLGIPAVPINRAISGGNALLNGETDNPLELLLGHKRQ